MGPITFPVSVPALFVKWKKIGYIVVDTFIRQTAVCRTYDPEKVPKHGLLLPKQRFRGGKICEESGEMGTVKPMAGCVYVRRGGGVTGPLTVVF